LGVHPLVLLSSDRRIRQALSGRSAIELVALNLRTIRREKCLTQETLAANARVSRHLIAKIEAEVHANPTLDLLDRIAQGLGANTADLFRDKP
jgi:transcriptional regulator with XRE-family HTH domain